MPSNIKNITNINNMVISNLMIIKITIINMDNINNNIIKIKINNTQMTININKKIYNRISIITKT